MKFLLLLITLLILANTTVLIYNSYVSTKFPLPIKTTNDTNVTINDNQITLPYNPRSNFIATYSIFYSYGATVQEVRQTSEGIEVITDITDKNVPRFIIDKNDVETFIQYKYEPEGNNEGVNVELGPASVENIKPGQKVILVSYFIAARNKWVHPEIYLITDNSELTTKEG